MNTLKHKMKHCYLNDLSNPNLWDLSRFDYDLAIIKNIFLFVKQIFLHHFFTASLWLKDRNENKAIRLFRVILAILFFISLISILMSIFFLFVVNFSFFKKAWLTIPWFIKSVTSRWVIVHEIRSIFEYIFWITNHEVAKLGQLIDISKYNNFQ